MQIFVVIWFILFFYIIGKGIAQFIENENSPVLTVPATIVDMRRKTHHHHSNGHHHHTHSYHRVHSVTKKALKSLHFPTKYAIITARE